MAPAALLVAAGLAWVAPAFAAGAMPALAGNDERGALVQCAWDRAPTTAATLLDRVATAKFHDYDAEGTPTVGLLMRIRAACPIGTSVIRPSAGGAVVSFIKKLKATRPKAVAEDQFSQRVHRCEYRYLDQPDGKAAAVAWGVGDDLGKHQLLFSAELSWTGSGPPSTPSGNVRPNVAAASVDAVVGYARSAADVETQAAGIATGGPYKLKEGSGLRRCQYVHADGSYSDA